MRNYLVAYDFDDTIFSGDSSMKFYKYCLLHHPSVLLSAFKQIGAFFKFVSGKYNKDQTKSVFFSYISHLKDLPEVVEAFWDKNESGLKGWYAEHCRRLDAGEYDVACDDDADVDHTGSGDGDGYVVRPKTCVISASPEFIIQPICRRLGIDYVICTKMDMATGQIIGRNCHGEEKPRRLYECFGGDLHDRSENPILRDGANDEVPNFEIIEFYSDSYSDDPVARLAGRAFLVQGEKLLPWNVEDKGKEKKTFVKSALSLKK